MRQVGKIIREKLVKEQILLVSNGGMILQVFCRMHLILVINRGQQLGCFFTISDWRHLLPCTVRAANML